MFSAWKLNQHANYNLESQKKHTKVPNLIHSTPTLESTRINQNLTTSDEFNSWSMFHVEMFHDISSGHFWPQGQRYKDSKHEEHIDLDMTKQGINNLDKINVNCSTSNDRSILNWNKRGMMQFLCGMFSLQILFIT